MLFRTQRSCWGSRLAGSLVAGLMLATGCGTAATERTSEAVTVIEIVDGDTVDLRFGSTVERVRLLGIDAPESVHPTIPEQCFGAEAAAELANLVPVGTEVEVFRDSQARDHFGRLLLHVVRAGDGLLINHRLVERGLAEATFYEPNTHFRAEFLTAERQARHEGRGLWGRCDGPDQPLQ